MTRVFSRHFDNWPLKNDERLNLMCIESKGRDLDDLLANAEISLEDWHGHEGPAWELGDLSDADFVQVCEMFNEFLRSGDNSDETSSRPLQAEATKGASLGSCTESR